MILNKQIFKSNNHEIRVNFKTGFSKEFFTRISDKHKEFFRIFTSSLNNNSWSKKNNGLFQNHLNNCKSWDTMNQSHIINDFTSEKCVRFKISEISNDLKQTKI